MKPNTDRPEACAIGDKVHVFVGGLYQVMSIEAAQIHVNKVIEAIAQAKGDTTNCGCSGEIHYACRASEEPKA